MRVTNRELRRRIRKILLKENKKVAGNFKIQQFNSIIERDGDFYITTNDTEGQNLKLGIMDAVSSMNKAYIGDFMENFAVFNYYQNEPNALNLNDVLRDQHGFTGADSPGADVIIGDRLAGELRSEELTDNSGNIVTKNTIEITTPLLSVKSSVAKNIGYEAGSDAALQMALQAYDVVKDNGTNLNNLTDLQNAFYSDSDVDRIKVPFGLIFGAWRRVGEPRLEQTINGTGVEKSNVDFVSATKEAAGVEGFVGELQTAGTEVINLTYNDNASTRFIDALDEISQSVSTLYYVSNAPIDQAGLNDLALSVRPGSPYPQSGSSTAPAAALLIISKAYAKLVLYTFSEYFKHNRIPASKVVFGGTRDMPDRTKLGSKTIEYIINNDADTLRKYFKVAFHEKEAKKYDSSDQRKKNGFPNFSDNDLDVIYNCLFNNQQSSVALQDIFNVRKSARFKDTSYKIKIIPSFRGLAGTEQQTSPYSESPHFQILYADPENNTLVVEKVTTRAGNVAIKMSFGGQDWTYSYASVSNDFRRTGAASISNAASNYNIQDASKKLYISSAKDDPLQGLDPSQVIEKEAYTTFNIDASELQRLKQRLPLSALGDRLIQIPEEMSAEDLEKTKNISRFDVDIPDMPKKQKRYAEYSKRLNQLSQASNEYKAALDESDPLTENILQFAQLVQHAQAILRLDPSKSQALKDIQEVTSFDTETKSKIAAAIAETIAANKNDSDFKTKLMGIKSMIPGFVKALVLVHLEDDVKFLIEFMDLSVSQMTILDKMISGLETYMMAIVMKHINDIATIKNQNSSTVFNRVATEISQLNQNFMTESRIYENILKKILYTAKKRR